MSDPTITLCELEWTLMWNVRGDPANSSFIREAEQRVGLALPLQPNTSASDPDVTVLWLAPSSWLVVARAHPAADDFDATRIALSAARGALFDVSASYVGWKISGSTAARVLNRSCPLDFHRNVFMPGGCAQSVLGHINALFYRPRDKAEFIVVVARSFAIDAWHELCESAETDGYRVGLRTSFDGTPS